MIVKKAWKGYYQYRIKYIYTGWFLFGIIPLYIIRHTV